MKRLLAIALILCCSAASFAQKKDYKKMQHLWSMLYGMEFQDTIYVQEIKFADNTVQTTAGGSGGPAYDDQEVRDSLRLAFTEIDNLPPPYSDSDIDGSEAAFNGWDKNAADDLQINDAAPGANTTYSGQKIEDLINAGDRDSTNELQGLDDVLKRNQNLTQQHNIYGNSGLQFSVNGVMGIMGQTNTLISSGADVNVFAPSGKIKLNNKTTVGDTLLVQEIKLGDGYVIKDSSDVKGGSAGTDDQTAAEVSVTPSGNLNSTDVQAALQEHQSDIDALASGAADGVLTGAAYDSINEEIDVEVASPGNNFSIDVSALAKDSDIPKEWAVSVLKYGTPNDSTPGAEVGINAALQANERVYIPAGNYLLSGSIVIPSNREIYGEGRVNLILDDSVNAYVIRNEDFVNGNENISLVGINGKINIHGNGYAQTRDYTSTVLGTASYWGLGLNFVRVKNLHVENLKIIETNAWGIAHFYGLHHTYHNIDFDQRTEPGKNGDGITGIGTSHLYISNITGYTSDDMIGVFSGGGSMEGNEMGVASADIRNVSIKNIFPTVKNDTMVPFRAVRFGGRDSTSIEGVYVDNVGGDFIYQAVDIANFWRLTHPGFFTKSVFLSNLSRSEITAERLSSASGHSLVQVGAGTHQSINISGAQITTSQYYPLLNVFHSSSTILENLNITNSKVNFLDSSDVIKSDGRILNLNFSNATITNGLGVFFRNHYPSDTVRVNIKNVEITDVQPGRAYIATGTGRLSLNGSGVPVNTTQITNRTNDIVTSTDGKDYFFNGTKYKAFDLLEGWVDYGIGKVKVSSVSDFDQYFTPGMYVTPSSGLLNSPAGIQTRFVIVVAGGANAYTSHTAIATNTGDMYFRHATGAAFSSWKRTWSDADFDYNDFSLKSTYDPQNISGDAFNLNIHTGQLPWANVDHPTTFPPAPHVHNINDVDNLQDSITRLTDSILNLHNRIAGFETYLDNMKDEVDQLRFLPKELTADRDMDSTDVFRRLYNETASGITLTITTDLDSQMGVGDQIVLQGRVSDIDIVAGTGVTLNGQTPSSETVVGPWASRVLEKTAANTYMISLN